MISINNLPNLKQIELAKTHEMWINQMDFKKKVKFSYI